MKKITAILAIVILLLLLCSCDGKGKGYDAPEDAALAFVQACGEQDADLFSTCIHPNMLEDWSDDWLEAPGEAQGKITKLEVMADLKGDVDSDEFDEYGIYVSESRTIAVKMTGYAYSDYNEISVVHEVDVILVNGSWYALGWS